MTVVERRTCTHYATRSSLESAGRIRWLPVIDVLRNSHCFDLPQDALSLIGGTHR